MSQKAWETAMGMRGYHGSHAEREDRAMNFEQNLEGVNKVLKECGFKSKVVAYQQSYTSGSYVTSVYRTKRGGKLAIKFWLCSTGNIHFKSVVRVLNKWKPFNMLINGQADRNCKQVAFWAEDTEAPKLKG